METKLDNVFLVVSDLNNTGDPKKGSPQAFRLTQSRLGIFFSDFASGRPLAGWPMMVYLELDIRHLETVSGGSQYQELNPRVYTSRLPLGLLATDHVGYASYDLTKLSDLIPIALTGQTNALPLGITNDEANAASAVFSKEPVQLSISALWIHPYGAAAINGLTPGLFSLRPDAIVVSAQLDDVPIRNETINAGIPSLQEPSIVDWRLSPGSFAITPGIKLGDGDCERFTPANVAVETYYFNRVVLQQPTVEIPPTIPLPGGVTGPSVPPLPSPSGAPAPPAIPALPGSPSVSPAVQPPVDPATHITTPAASPARIFSAAATKASPVSFASVQTTVVPASIFIYKTEWFQLGHSLGKVLYTLALAPGENANVAVIDWSREDTASRQEATALTEALIADLRRDRLITETIDGILNEKQSGGSTLGAGSLVAGAAGTTGPFGALAGLGLSLGGGSAWTEGHRDLHDSTVQTLSDRIQQSSSALRELRSTVVVSSHQQEQNVITTRNLTNYNHSHTLTILYYELLRHLRVVTSSDRAFDALLVRFPDLGGIDRKQPESLFPYLTFLKGRLLDPSLAPSFAAYEVFEIELNRDDPQSQPTEEQQTKIRSLIGNVAIASWKDNDPNHSALLMRVEGISGPIALSTKRQVDYDPGSAKVLDSATSFTLPNFQGNDQDKEFREWKHVTFALDFVDLQAWSNLVEIKFQCLFKDESKDNQFNLRFEELVAVTDHGALDLNAMPNHVTYMPGNNSNLLKSVGDRNDGKNTGSTINESPLRLPASAKSSRPAFARLSLDQQTAIFRLLNHVVDYLPYYSLVYWITNDEKRVSVLQALGTSFDASYWPATIFGDSLVFPRLTSRRLQPDEFVKEERLITLPTRGVFADAKMGECNVSERIDNTRFWDWQKSPIPFQAPAVTGVTPASHAQQPQGLQPTQFPTPLVSIQNAPAAPDPAIAAGLTALTTPNVFRDLSVASQVAGVVQQVTDAAKQVAIAAGTLAKAKGTSAPSGGTSGGGSGGSSGGGKDGGTPQGSGGDSAPQSTGGETSGVPAMTPQDALDRMQVLRSMQPEIGSQAVQDGAKSLADQLVQASFPMKSTGPTSPAGFLWVEGIDISYAQGAVDWSKVAAQARLEFAYIRASIAQSADNHFATNWAAARGKILCGPYHYFYPEGDDDAMIAQAKFFQSTVAKTAALEATDLPPMVDVERFAKPDPNDPEPDPKKKRQLPLLSPAQYSHNLILFLETVAELFGRQPLLYTSPGPWRQYVADDKRFGSFHLWIAQYLGTQGTLGGQDTYAIPSAQTIAHGPSIPAAWKKWSIWQYAVWPGIDGIANQVDRDLIYLPIGQSILEFLNGPPPGVNENVGTTV